MIEYLKDTLEEISYEKARKISISVMGYWFILFLISINSATLFPHRTHIQSKFDANTIYDKLLNDWSKIFKNFTYNQSFDTNNYLNMDLIEKNDKRDLEKISELNPENNPSMVFFSKSKKRFKHIHHSFHSSTYFTILVLFVNVSGGNLLKSKNNLFYHIIMNITNNITNIFWPCQYFDGINYFNQNKLTRNQLLGKINKSAEIGSEVMAKFKFRNCKLDYFISKFKKYINKTEIQYSYNQKPQFKVHITNEELALLEISTVLMKEITSIDILIFSNCTNFISYLPLVLSVS